MGDQRAFLKQDYIIFMHVMYWLVRHNLFQGKGRRVVLVAVLLFVTVCQCVVCTVWRVC